MLLPSFLGFLFLVALLLLSIVAALTVHAAVLDAFQFTGIVVEVVLLGASATIAAVAVTAAAIAVDAVHVGLLTFAEVLLGFHLTETLGVDGIDVLPFFVVVAAAGGVLLLIVVTDAIDGGEGSALGKALVHGRHLVVHALAACFGKAHVDGVGDYVPGCLAVTLEGLHAEVDESQQGQEDDQRENVLGLSEVQTLEFL